MLEGLSGWDALEEADVLVVTAATVEEESEVDATGEGATAPKKKKKKSKAQLRDQMGKKDPYDLLELEDLRWRATADDIRKSYRRLVLEHHPDKQVEGRQAKEAAAPASGTTCGCLADVIRRRAPAQVFQLEQVVRVLLSCIGQQCPAMGSKVTCIAASDDHVATANFSGGVHVHALSNAQPCGQFSVPGSLAAGAPPGTFSQNRDEEHTVKGMRWIRGSEQLFCAGSSSAHLWSFDVAASREKTQLPQALAAGDKIGTNKHGGLRGWFAAVRCWLRSWHPPRRPS